MKTIPILLLTITLNCNAQLTTTAERVIQGVGVTTVVYGFARIDHCGNDFKQSVVICSVGTIISALPCLMKLPERIEVNSSGICFKLKMKKYKCKFKPYK